MSEEANKKRVDLPYGAEYSKSGRAACKACKETIAQGTLRMAIRTQSRFFDGLQDNWFHFECFWRRARKADINEASIRGMEWLKWEDQERVRARIKVIQEDGGAAEEMGIGTPKPAVPKVEHAKAGSGKCFTCKEKIPKGELRIGYKASNYHPQCFQTLNVYQGGADEIGGFEDLIDGEKQALEKLFGKAAEKRPAKEENGEGPPKKKEKTETVEDDPETLKKLKKQSDTLWAVREKFQENLDSHEMEELLVANGRYKTKGGPDKMLDQLIDCAVFGVPAKCTKCENGILFFSTSAHAYQCMGNISEYTRCMHSTRKPDRVPFRIPSKMKKANEFLASYQIPQLTERVYSAAMLKEVPLEKAKPGPSLTRTVGATSEKSFLSSKSGGRQKMLVKNGCTVDPAAEKAEKLHVYIDKEKIPWQATLGSADVYANKNSFYKLQLLEHDEKTRYYVFRSWGRVGTTIGGAKTESFGSDLKSAKAEFERLFLEKSHNNWEDRHNFKKHPGFFDILEMEFNIKDDGSIPQLDVNTSKSLLPMPVKELLSMIFDIKAMTKALQEMEIDTDRMPLGRLSKRHIQNAYRVLTELQDLLSKEDKPSYEKIVDASNRFYTLIPFSSGTKEPPLLNDLKLVKEKSMMLDDLLEMEIAMNIIKQEESENNEKDPFDKHYEKLHCAMEVVDKDSNEYKRIDEYMKNTHAETHRGFTLEIVHILKVSREAEEERFKKDIPNHLLLWHGSRLSNYAGILSKGLRIAPPEAPVTGYMFGKGIYFADMASKSANYCHAYNSDGLLLLSEVALGEVQEEKHAREIRKLKSGKHSVKGIGGTEPDPKQTVYDENGVGIPLGKPVSNNATDLSLLYNEYIVYNEAQVKMRYLVRANFKMEDLL